MNAAQPANGYSEASEGVLKSEGAPEAITPEEVRAQTERILCSPTFIRSRRLGRFLRFTVDQALEGRQSTLKEYLVGVEVFNKMESFDPRIDSIVRVEARRLRSKLDHYYAGEGSDDPIVIQFMKGSYVPVIMRREHLPPGLRQMGTRALGAVSITVSPFANLGSDFEDNSFCSGLSEDLISALTKIPGFCVLARNQSGETRSKLALEGSVRRHGDRFRISAQLIDLERGIYLWSETYERDIDDVFAVQEQISKSIVESLSTQVAAA
jgi:serine/threonine-protein kinase